MSKKAKQKPLVHDEPVLNLGTDKRPILIFQQEFAAMAKRPLVLNPPHSCRVCALTHGFKTEPDPRYEERIQEFFKLYGITDTPEERKHWAEIANKGVFFTQSEQAMAEELRKAIGKRTSGKRQKED